MCSPLQARKAPAIVRPMGTQYSSRLYKPRLTGVGMI